MWKRLVLGAVTAAGFGLLSFPASAAPPPEVNVLPWQPCAGNAATGLAVANVAAASSAEFTGNCVNASSGSDRGVSATKGAFVTLTVTKAPFIARQRSHWNTWPTSAPRPTLSSRA
jgi:hypothetical protein